MKTIAHGSLWVLLSLSACKGSTLDLGQNEPSPSIVVIVSKAIDHGVGVDGQLKEAMSTSFQPAPWQYQFFDLHPEAVTELQELTPQHVHIQALSAALPWKMKTGTPADWDFSELDAMVPPILRANPGAMFQIMAPDFLANSFLNGDDSLNMDTANDFARYCGYLVQYYNLGGITYPEDAGGPTVLNPQGTSEPIFWWGILGDFNPTYSLNGGQYEQVYNLAVAKMLAVNGDAGALHFSAFEYSDPTNPSVYRDLDAFLANVTQQVDVISLHVFPAASLEPSDQGVFRTTPSYVADLNNVYARIRDAGPGVANAPVWITENNVNSQVPAGGSVFVNDPRGTDAFFAAWRPYVFSQFGKAGNRALYHWDFTAGNIPGNPDTDPQQAEVDYSTGNRLISYWVDYWLSKLFPSTETSKPLDILALSSDDAGAADFPALAASMGIEVLATTNEQDDSVVVMVVDVATQSSVQPSANVFDGHGVARNVLVDISDLGSFAAGTLRLIVDPKIDNGPQGNPAVPVDVTSSRIPVNLPGYGVAFLQLSRRGDGDGGVHP